MYLAHMSVLIKTPSQSTQQLFKQAAEQYAIYLKMQEETGGEPAPEVYSAAAALSDTLTALHDHKRAQHGLSHIQ